MKKIILILVASAAMLASAFNANAIEPQWTKGTSVGAANIGFGVGTIGAEASFDYVVVDSWWKGHFTVGGQIDFSSWFKAHDTALSVMPRATYGLNITDSFEVHVGVATGFGLNHYKYVDGGDSYSDFYFANSEFAGLRFFFTDSFGLSAEVGYTTRMPYARVGVAFKF